MGAIFLSGVAPLIVALFAVVIWDRHRRKRGWPRRKPDYVWTFIHGGILYVSVALFSFHYISHISYSELLKDGFGEAQVSIAFLGSAFEALWALWDTWEGKDSEPTPEA